MRTGSADAAWVPAYRLQISLSDFEILRRLGDGSFSTVVLAKYKGDGRLYAVKIVNKSLILRNKVCQAVLSISANGMLSYDISWQSPSDL